MAPGSSNIYADDYSYAVQVSKRVSRKWSSAEVAALVQGINQVSSASEVPNWSEIARNVPGRTAKQCREKYKNDLRPDLSKLPWVNREEYIIARVHATVGNKWADICRYIPDRSENTIKNHWNATLRSNSDRRMKSSFLWTYCQLVLQRGPSLEAFQEAKQRYAATSYPERQPLEEFEVNDDFLSGDRPPTPGKVVPSQLVAPSQAPSKKQLGKRVRRKQVNLSASEDDTSDDEEDSWSPQRAPKHKCVTRGRSSSSAPTSRQSSFMTDPIPPPPPLAGQQPLKIEHEAALQPEGLLGVLQQYADASVELHLADMHQLPKDKLSQQPDMLGQQQQPHVHEGIPAVPEPMWNANLFTPSKGAKLAGFSAEEIALLEDFGMDTPGTCLLISPQRAGHKEQGCKDDVEKPGIAFALRECGLAPGETPECARNLKVEDLFGAMQEPLPQYNDYWSPKKGATPATSHLDVYDSGLYGLLHVPAPSLPSGMATCPANQPPSQAGITMHHPSIGTKKVPCVETFEHLAYQQGTIPGHYSAVPASAPVHDMYHDLHPVVRPTSVQPQLEPMGSWVHTSMAVPMPPLQTSERARIMAVPVDNYYGTPHNGLHLQQHSGSMTPGLLSGMYTAYGGAMVQPEGMAPMATFMHQQFAGNFMQHNHMPGTDASMVQPHGIPTMGAYANGMQPATGCHMPSYGYHMTGNNHDIMATHMVHALPAPQGPVHHNTLGCPLLL